jgi:hypothetical protein
MNIAPDSLPYGAAPAILLDCAQQLHEMDGRPFTFDDFCVALGASRSESEPVIEQLIVDGFLYPGDSADATYICSSRMGQLALAKISHGLPRDEATRLLNAVIEKSEAINADPEKYPYAVTCLAVFGSFLTEKEVLGDLDIGVTLSLRECRREKFGLTSLKRGMSSYAKTLAALRLRKPAKISIHEMDEVIRLETPYRVIFGEMPSLSSQ